MSPLGYAVPHAIIVGSGVGGLCAAGHLARGGWHVTLVEKNRRLGGRCDRIEFDGHHFDTGPTLYVLPELYSAEFEALGIDPSKELDLIRVDPSYQVFFESGEKLRMTSDRSEMRAQLELLEPGSFEGFERYLSEGREHYAQAMADFIRQDFRRVVDLMSVGNLSALVELRLLIRHYSHVSRFFKAPALRAAFTFQDLYMGLDPAVAPATFSLIPYSELTHGVWFPRGGMYQVVKSLAAVAEEGGAQVRLGQEVAAIETKTTRVTGVRLESGEVLEADIVLANADLTYVLESLLPRAPFHRIRPRRPLSFSSVSFFWALDRKLEGLNTHNLFLSDSYLDGFREMARGRPIPDKPCVYVHAPSRVDPDMAPDGQDTLVAVVPAAHLRRGDTDWVTVRDAAREAVVGSLRMLGAELAPESIKREISFLPSSWRRRYHLASGAIHGLGHQLYQLGAFRPHNRHWRYHNLYFAGASTHPGSGVPTALVSGRLAAERIQEDHDSK